jgi:hypothetical protein
MHCHVHAKTRFTSITVSLEFHTLTDETTAPVAFLFLAHRDRLHGTRRPLYTLSSCPPPPTSGSTPLEDQVMSNGGMLPRTMPRTGTQGSSRPFHHRFWRGLLGRDRRWISWRKSARAIVFSSCQSLFYVQLEYMPEYRSHLSQCRAECSDRLHSSCLGIPLPRMGTWSHLCTYV